MAHFRITYHFITLMLQLVKVELILMTLYTAGLFNLYWKNKVRKLVFGGLFLCCYKANWQCILHCWKACLFRSAALSHSLIIALASLTWLKNTSETGWSGSDGLKCAAQHANIQLPSQRGCGNVHFEAFGFFCGMSRKVAVLPCSSVWCTLWSCVLSNASCPWSPWQQEVDAVYWMGPNHLCVLLSEVALSLWKKCTLNLLPLLACWG